MLAMFYYQLQKHYSDIASIEPDTMNLNLLDWENWCEYEYDRSSSAYTTLPMIQFGHVWLPGYK